MNSIDIDPNDLVDPVRYAQRGYPHAVWARVPLTEPLEALRQKVERACDLSGLGRETRRFTPHVTLARLDRSAGALGHWLAARGDLAAEPWAVGEFILFESRLGHTGAVYEEVVRYTLRG